MSTSVVKWSEGPCNWVSIVTGRYVNNMKFLLIWLFRFSHSFMYFPFYVVSLYILLHVLYGSV